MLQYFKEIAATVAEILDDHVYPYCVKLIWALPAVLGRSHMG